MINLFDALKVARTKFRVNKVRTSLVVGAAGIMFGLIMALVMISNGIFSSVDRFQDEGLNNRALVVFQYSDSNYLSHDSLMASSDFVKRVEKAYLERIAKKKAAAIKYGIPFDNKFEDPSPVIIDGSTNQKTINEEMFESVDVASVYDDILKEKANKWDPARLNEKYPSAKIIQSHQNIMPTDGVITLLGLSKKEQPKAPKKTLPDFEPSLQILDESLTKPFILTDFDASKGELPIILPHHDAEKILGYKKLDDKASTTERLERLTEVRSRIGEVTISYCYRNMASIELLQFAENQIKEFKDAEKRGDILAPEIIYRMPAEGTCGDVKVVQDNRSPEEKSQQANFVKYQKAINEYRGTPSSRMIKFRAIGLTGSFNTGEAWSIKDMVADLLASNLGYNSWSIPADLLSEVPSKFKPSEVFQHNLKQDKLASGDSVIVEFGNRDEARKALMSSMSGEGEIYSMPFGSGMLMVDEAKTWLSKALNWVLVFVGGIAVVILMSIIGRTVAEGRRESAVFRAIGASRKDIAAIYGSYTLLLASRTAIFSIVLGATIALLIEILYAREATLGARYAYAASDMSKDFHLIGFTSPYLLLIIAVIFTGAVLSAIAPIILGARRSPIQDMRNDA